MDCRDGKVKKRQAYIGLGTNMGDRAANLRQAVEMMQGRPGIKVDSVSSVYITEPWGNRNQDDFYNQVVRIETDLSARELLHQLQKIEIKMGRQPSEKWGPRIIDLDIILYGDQLVQEEDLKIPHPYAQQRLFVLIPLEEIDPEIVFPDSGMSIREVLIRVLGREEENTIKRME
jgi:2-amino-4-hydroxy-6-hydroxymethyldihydropteridine diphosphokinase